MTTKKESSKVKQAEQMLENQLDVPSFANNGYLYPNVKIVQTPCLLEKILLMLMIILSITMIACGIYMILVMRGL